MASSEINPVVFAADNHNVAGDTDSFLSDAKNYVVSAVVSGAHSFYNTAVDVGNFLGGDYERADTYEYLTDMDSNLGQYYYENKQAADLGGLVLGSIVPGTLAFKAVNYGSRALAAASAGRFGTNIASATGLMPTVSEALYAKAATQMAEGTVTSIINRTTVAGLAAGLGEQTLMTAAAEVLIAGTMAANPIIEDLTFSDHVKNTVVGAAFFGPIFAGIGAVKGFGGIRSAVALADKETMPWRVLPSVSPKLDDATALYFLYNHKAKFPAIPTEGITEARRTTLQKFADQTMASLDNKILERWVTITGGDAELALMFRNAGASAKLEDIVGTVAYLKEARRGGGEMLYTETGLAASVREAVGRKRTLYHAGGKVYATEEAAIAAGALDDVAPKITAIDYTQELNILNRNTAPKNLSSLTNDELVAKGYHAVIERGDTYKQVKAIAPLDDYLAEAVEAGIRASSPYSQKYVILQGAKAGTISADAPRIANLADRLAPGQKIKVTAKPNGAKLVTVGDQKITVPAVTNVATDDLDEVMAKYYIAATSPELKAGIVIKDTDLPLLEKAYFQKLSDFRIEDSAGNLVQAPTGRALESWIAAQKSSLASSMKMNSDEVAVRLNMGLEGLEGNGDTVMFYAQSVGNDAYTKPTYAKLGYHVADFDMAGEKMTSLVSREQIAALSRQYDHQVTANFFGASFNDMTTLTADDILDVTRYSSGQGFASFGQGQYLTPESKAEYIGRITHNEITKAVNAVDDGFAAVSQKLIANQAAAIEVEHALQTARRTADSYVLQGNNLVLKAKHIFDADTIAKAEKMRTAGDSEAAIAKYVQSRVFQNMDSVPETIALAHADSVQFLKTHIELNAKRVAYDNGRRAALGRHTISMLPGELYAPPPDFRRYPHFALVVDKVTEETRYIGAYTKEDLRVLASKVPDSYHVNFKSTTDEYYKALGQYDYASTITDAAIDTDLKRNGALSAFFPKTDPEKIVTDIVGWHKETASRQVRNMTYLHYREAIDTLEDVGRRYTAEQTSVARKSPKVLTENVDNPYADMVKTMMDMSKAEDYRVWMYPQHTVDAWVSRAFNKIDQLRTASPSQATLDSINDALQASGYRGPLYNADTVLAANHAAPQSVLSNFVRKANSLATTFMLRLDAIQALNNAIGTNIMLAPEMGYLIRKIEQIPQAAEKLNAYYKVAVPGSQHGMRSSAKVIAKAYTDFFSDLSTKGQPLISRYDSLGWLPSYAKQLSEHLDAAAIPQQITKQSFDRLEKSWQWVQGKGEVITGNKHSEMMGRFVAARVADQITDIALNAGVIARADKLTIMNSFVNKVHGSTLASQRPILFQGPVGQALSLFQTYQFNLMQQLFKYIGDGQTRSAATLMGMQTAIYGVNGIPAFHLMNSTIIGNASGNIEHQDLYTAMPELAGKEAGEWIMFGMAANMLGINIYSRGDINPRHATIVPMSPLDYPAVAISGKFFGNLIDTAERMGNGAPVGAALLQGLEHIAINRPLSGLARVIQGYTTTGQGSLVSRTRTEDISGANDYHVLANFSRIAGARPLDEAIILDAHYRFQAYRAKEYDKMRALGAAVKTKIISGSPVSSEELNDMMDSYIRAGGRAENFNRQFLSWYKAASQSTVNEVASKLNTSAGRYLQRVMGGEGGLVE